MRYFVLFENTWRDATAWPPAGAAPEAWYLHSAGGANTSGGDGRLDQALPGEEPCDVYVYDPADPVPSSGGHSCCLEVNAPMGAYDQSRLEQRKDVLVYTTKALKHPMEVVGPIQAVLYIASSARDTDFTAKLVDVFPDGTAQNLTDGILRLRYRNSLEKPELAAPGQIYRVTIDAGVTANVFLKGHRIRLEVSSSNFPRFDRNANTGGPVEQAVKLVKATQTIYHDAAHPSSLILPVIQ